MDPNGKVQVEAWEMGYVVIKSLRNEAIAIPVPET